MTVKVDNAERLMDSMYGKIIPTFKTDVEAGYVATVLQLISASRNGALCGVHTKGGTSKEDCIQDCVDTVRAYVRDSVAVDHFEKTLRGKHKGTSDAP